MLARRFLYCIAVLIVLLLAAGLAWTLFSQQLMRRALVPPIPFTAMAADTTPDYARAASWAARPGLADDPALWLPPGIAALPPGKAAIFFVPPTSFIDRTRWNARIDEPSAEARLRLFVSGQASVFTAAGQVWAPRYRQATLGAFLTDAPDAGRALAFAYADVSRAFDAFLAQAPADAPIILAGHSQGSRHLLQLLVDKVRGKPVARRIVAIYAAGWPVSTTADLPALGFPACTAPAQTGCVLSWESFADPADASQLRIRYDAGIGFTGAPRRATPALCVNPLTGTAGGAAAASANLGALQPEIGYTGGTLVPGLIPARCRGDGLLMIGETPDGFGSAVLPGNNFHVFDYALFWSNLRADALRRLAAYEAAR